MKLGGGGGGGDEGQMKRETHTHAAFTDLTHTQLTRKTDEARMRKANVVKRGKS